MRVVQDDNARVLQVRTGEVDIALQHAVQPRRPRSKGRGRGRRAWRRSTAPPRSCPTCAPCRRSPTSRCARRCRWPSTGRRWWTRCCSATASPRSRRSTARASCSGPTSSPSPYDVEAAKALMAESGFPDGFTRRPHHPQRRRDGRRRPPSSSPTSSPRSASRSTSARSRPAPGGRCGRAASSSWSTSSAPTTSIDPAMNIPFDFWSKEEGGSDAAFSGYRNDEIVEISMAAEAELDPAERGRDSTASSSRSRWRRARSSTSSTRRRSGRRATTSTASRSSRPSRTASGRPGRSGVRRPSGACPPRAGRGEALSASRKRDDVNSRASLRDGSCRSLPVLFGIVAGRVPGRPADPGRPAPHHAGHPRLRRAAGGAARRARASTGRSGRSSPSSSATSLRGELGTSLFFRRPVLEVILERLPVTVVAHPLAVLLSLLVCVPLAVAWRRCAKGVRSTR